jgi:transmembrane protein 222
MSGQMESRDVQPGKNLYPYCILWSPLPPITWILPFIGHTGIADSQGVIHDFAGPYHIGVGNMAFGAPTRYIQLNPELCKEFGWDDGLHEGCTICTYANSL